MKRLVLGTSIAVVVLAGCGAAAPSAAPTQGTASLEPSVSAAPSVSVSPSSGVVFPSWYTGGENGAGTLAAGSHATRSFSPGFTFTVPAGWVNSSEDVGFFGLFPDTPANEAEFGSSERLAHEIVMGPHGSPYFTCDAWEDNSGSTAAEMVAKVVANEALETSEPVDVTIGGLVGKQFDVRLDPSWTETCPGDPPGSDLADGRTRGLLLDTPDGRVIVIFMGSLHSADHEAFVVEAMPIIESLQFDVAR